MSLADVPNTNFFTAAEQLFAVQLSWKDIYSILCDNSDDYFVTPLYLNSSTFTADANRQYTYLYAVPTDFYRLRLFQYKTASGSQFLPMSKMSIETFGNSQQTPGYRFEGTNIAIYNPSNYDTFAVWYYPSPAVLTTATDLVYPNNMIPEIMAYQVAIEIRRKQNLDISGKQQRRDELIKTMIHQMCRDESKAEPIRNQFNTGFAPYI
jgi:hypothetical protein